MLIKQRHLNLRALLKKKSFFLFGPRATGKSYLIRTTLQDAAVNINMLRQDHLLRLSAEPYRLESMIVPQLKHVSHPWIVIDEIQKAPALLDEVHRLIEERHWTFLLTGSSARKLKRGQANMLGGRARTAELFPMTWSELEDFDLDRYLRFGGLPPVILSEDPQEDLYAYVTTYLKEEIQEEGLIKKLPPFSRFLQTAALANGQMLNFAKIGNDCGVPPATVREYYHLLIDTLVGDWLQPWTQSKSRKAIRTAKFYFFDLGVAHTLAENNHLDRNSQLYGTSFEQFIWMELRAYLSYRRKHTPLCYWRSVHDQEVDFVVDDTVAIEVKASRKTSDRDLRSIRALAEEKKIKTFYLISQDPTPWSTKVLDAQMHALPWDHFLEALWDDHVL